MAYSVDQWEKAKAYFESGELSLGEIAKKTGIDKSQISRKSKIQQWESGKNADYIAAKVKIAQKNTTENTTTLQILNEIADKKTRHLEFLHNVTLKNISVMAKKLNEDASIQDHKMAQDTIDKAGITLGVFDRHPAKVEIQNTNAQQNNENTVIEFKRI